VAKLLAWVLPGRGSKKSSPHDQKRGSGPSVGEMRGVEPSNGSSGLMPMWVVASTLIWNL